MTQKTDFGTAFKKVDPVATALGTDTSINLHLNLPHTKSPIIIPRMENNNDRSFVAINYISCKPGYRERFEELFATRAHAIDRMPGFQRMEVLKPDEESGHYLIVSHWDSKDSFSGWTNSPEFREGHQRGFEDIKLARERGEDPPMSSDFKTYKVIAR